LETNFDRNETYQIIIILKAKHFPYFFNDDNTPKKYSRLGGSVCRASIPSAEVRGSIYVVMSKTEICIIVHRMYYKL